MIVVSRSPSAINTGPRRWLRQQPVLNRHEDVTMRDRANAGPHRPSDYFVVGSFHFGLWHFGQTYTLATRGTHV